MLGTRKDCPDYECVLNSGVEFVLWQSIEIHLVPVACVLLYREVSALQQSGLEGFHYMYKSGPECVGHNGYFTCSQIATPHRGLVVCGMSACDQAQGMQLVTPDQTVYPF